MPEGRVTRREFVQTTSKTAGAALVAASSIGLTPAGLSAQINRNQPQPILSQAIQSADVVEFQLRQYLMKLVPPLPSPKTAEEWTRESRRLREHGLGIIFHGWPTEWVDAPPKFEDIGLIPSGKGYRTRKLRFEIVPGFWSTALLYEPENVKGKVPATLNLNGHTPQGKAAEYKQKRCINNALQGMYALSLEWLGMGELGGSENSHWCGAHLNLVGACATGLFYLAMRKGLDYLCEHPNVDAKRIGVAGLSGGAWQTITLSALDERVAAAVPVSGYFALISGIERLNDVGDIEYNAPDLKVQCDSAVLTAMRAPRPTLLIYGAEDEYGIRATMEKPHLYDDIKPFFQLYGKEAAFAWHENIDPGTHNFLLDNRQRSYAFFTEHFGMPVVNREIPVNDQIKTDEELTVGLPPNNLTILGLARKLAAANRRSAPPADPQARSRWARSATTRLNEVVRYEPVNLKHAWPVSSTKNKGMETVSYRLEYTNDLSATAVWLKAIDAPAQSPITVVINDEGMQAVRPEEFTEPATMRLPSANSIAWRLNQGEQVLALNVLFVGDASPDKLGSPKSLWDPSALYTQLLASLGERPIGLEAAQLLAATKWLQEKTKAQSARVESTGIRTQVIALIASALQPATYSELLVREGMPSFGYLLEKPVAYQDAPDLFCLDLYKEFDIPELIALAHPTKVRTGG
jgi:dienelactone hydrolase